MALKVETQIKLNRFKLRNYQFNFAQAFEQQRYRKFLAVWPRRCLAGDTHIILSDGSYKLLKNIEVGDLVASWDGRRFIADRVVNKWATGVKESVTLQSSQQKDLVTSLDHEFAHIGDKDDPVIRWNALKDIEISRYLIVYNGNGYDRCSFSFRYSKPVELYDIETENNHNFVANGYLVHNSGKDYTAFNLVLRRALLHIGSYFYCLPTFKQSKLVIWDSISNDGTRFLDCIPKELIKRINAQELLIELINGSIIRLIGSDTYDTSLVGTNPICVIFSEFSLADDRAYKFILPIMNANGGTVVVLSTPRGRNAFYDMYQIALNNPKDWFCEHLTVNETQHISRVNIKRDIASGEISEELAAQEYDCSFSLGIEGSYYGRYMDKMRFDDRIGQVPYEPGFPVHVACDLGMRDSTVLIFFQAIGTVIHVIDCYENHSQGLEHYVQIIRDKEYIYGRFIAPHDIAVRELGTGMSRLEKARNLGVNFLVAPRLSINDGIEAVRNTLPRTYIDKVKCAPLIKALENYRKEFDNLRKVYHDKPVHDNSSHYADGFRYACLMLNKLGPGLSPEDLKERHRKAVYGNKNFGSPFKGIY